MVLSRGTAPGLSRKTLENDSLVVPEMSVYSSLTAGQLDQLCP
jgi:hypothetical protein